jgi:hypothetical protein
MVIVLGTASGQRGHHLMSVFFYPQAEENIMARTHTTQAGCRKHVLDAAKAGGVGMKKTRVLTPIIMAFLFCGTQVQGQESFKKKFARLAKIKTNLFKVTARKGEEIPEATLHLSFGPGATISVSRGRGQVKDMLEDHDITSVVNRNLRTVKFCYCRALKADPKFEGEAIIGMQIQTTGKVKKVTIDPEDMAGNDFGKCLSPRVSKWKFPKFKGKKEDGLRVKSIGYEFPLAFSQAD